MTNLEMILMIDDGPTNKVIATNGGQSKHHYQSLLLTNRLTPFACIFISAAEKNSAEHSGTEFIVKKQKNSTINGQ